MRIKLNGTTAVSMDVLIKVSQLIARVAQEIMWIVQNMVVTIPVIHVNRNVEREQTALNSVHVKTNAIWK